MLLVLVYPPARPLHRPASPALKHQPVVLQGTLPFPAQSLILVPVIFHGVLVDPFLQPVHVPLNVHPFPEYIKWSPQFSVFCKLGKNAIHHHFQVIAKDAKDVKCSSKDPGSTQLFNILQEKRDTLS